MTAPVGEAAVIDRLFHAQCNLGASDLHLCVGMPPLVRKDGQIMPLDASFPALTDAPIVATRCCLYCDTPDEHFWIGRHPEAPGLTVASGDSGHGFKFAPVLGRLIAARVGADRRFGLLNATVSVHPMHGASEQRRLATPAEVRGELESTFGISVPPGRETEAAFERVLGGP